jgi:hypothetical protein
MCYVFHVTCYVIPHYHYITNESYCKFAFNKDICYIIYYAIVMTHWVHPIY